MFWENINLILIYKERKLWRQKIKEWNKKKKSVGGKFYNILHVV